MAPPVPPGQAVPDIPVVWRQHVLEPRGIAGARIRQPSGQILPEVPRAAHMQDLHRRVHYKDAGLAWDFVRRSGVKVRPS